MRTVRPLCSAVAAAHPDNTVTNSRYTFYNFLFLNLYEQFRRPINFYFLMVAALQFISVIAPVSPLSTLLPLLLAFSLTALKEGFDDVKRHRQDTKYNRTARTVLDLKTRSWQTRANSRIRVGDVILLRENEEIPCDVVVVAATQPVVFIQTDNLDGELDLKPREIVTPCLNSLDMDGTDKSVARNPNHIYVDDDCDVLISKLTNIKFICPPPTAIVDSFDGSAEFQHLTNSGENDSQKRTSMSYHHLLPQACLLRRAKTALCVAVYTGEETKCGMNKRPAPVKWARIDQDVSRYAIFVFCCQMVSALVFGLTGYFMNRGVEERMWYLQVPSNESKVAYLIYPLRFFLLTSVMIPVSFKFLVDISKYYMAMTIEWDETMKHGDPNSEGCVVKNSSILEDLGQVDYVFSDKTGTLTQNVMELIYVTVGDRRLLLHQHPLEATGKTNMDDIPSDEHVLHFGRILSLCNAVETVEAKELTAKEVTSSPQYQAASPDEEALCRGSARLHVRLLLRNAQRTLLDVNGVEEQWIVHYTFPFLSELKSMGVIVEEESTGKIYYFVKGADDRIMNMITSTSLPDSLELQTGRELRMEVLKSHLNAYADCGLRTLLVAEKRLTREDLDNFMKQVRCAELALHNRQEKILELRALMETGVSFAGITAIEDKLQEGVHDTVRDFLRAGIKVWMLTGDKVQTAVQIALSCALFSPGNRILYVTSENTNENETWEEHMMALSLPTPQDDEMESVEGEFSSRGEVIINNELLYGLDPFSQGEHQGVFLNNMQSEPDRMASSTFHSDKCVLVVEGGVVLERILNTESLRERFFELSQNCVSVICARVTPSQKAAVTNIVRSTGVMTLAIGDGGNDVAMLQGAHVGVGIVGKEGQQAARAADFVISRFSDLRTLVFVHGHLTYTRTAFVIKYSFYKSMLISFIQLAYNVFGMYMSGGSFWNSFSLVMWNGVYTLPQTLFYCLDRIAPRTILEKHTFLYKMTRRAIDMSISEFFLMFMIRGVIQSLIVLWLVLSIYGSSFVFANNGWTASNDVTFTVAYSSLIVSQMFTMLLESHTITFFNAIFIFGMPMIYAAVTSVYSSLPQFQYFGVWKNSINLVSFFTVFGIAFLIVLPVLGLTTLRRAWNPDARDVLRMVAVRNLRHRKLQYGFGRHLSQLTRWLFCLPEEGSRICSTPLLSTQGK